MSKLHIPWLISCSQKNHKVQVQISKMFAKFWTKYFSYQSKFKIIKFKSKFENLKQDSAFDLKISSFRNSFHIDLKIISSIYPYFHLCVSTISQHLQILTTYLPTSTSSIDQLSISISVPSEIVRIISWLLTFPAISLQKRFWH